MTARHVALALACALGAGAPDALAEPPDASRSPPTPAGESRPVRRSEQAARVVIVVGGVTLSIGVALSWTGIAALVYQATQHHDVPWAAPVSIASVPCEVVGSVLVLGGALDLTRQPPADVPSTPPLAATVVSARPVFSLPLLRAEF